MIPPHTLERIESLGPWFHTIDLGNGTRIERDPVHGGDKDYPQAFWRELRGLLPVAIEGLRVLDVGCNSGFFSIEMKRAGAARVLGLEPFPRHLEQAELVREILQMEIELRCMSVYEISEDLGAFDITLFLGVLYHLKNPIGALENLTSVTEGILVVESAVLPETRTRLPHTRDYGGIMHQFAFCENVDGVEALQNWFVPSVGGLKALVRTAGFKNIVTTSVLGERAIVIASR